MLGGVMGSIELYVSLLINLEYVSPDHWGMRVIIAASRLLRKTFKLRNKKGSEKFRTLYNLKSK